MPKTNLGEIMDKILNLPPADDDRWGQLVPITDVQAEIFADFSRKYAEMRVRHQAEDDALMNDYERRMRHTVVDGAAAEKAFQIIAIDGRRYVRWEIDNG